MREIEVPAPFLLGSLFGVWSAGVVFKNLRDYLTIARGVHKFVIVGLAVFIGAMFSSGLLAQIESWWLTVVLMVLLTVIATMIGFFYLHYVRGYERNLAIMCCMPGGQAELIAMSRDLVEKDYVVALCHLVRVTLVLCFTPVILMLGKFSPELILSEPVINSLMSAADIGLISLSSFVLVGGVGFSLGIAIRLPMPHLFGPLLVSSLLHSLGVVELPRVSEFIVLAQLVIGAGVGSRLASVDGKEILGVLVDAVVNSVLLLTVYVGTAWILSLTLPLAFFDLYLAFAPGGIYEVTLMALLFSLDVAFVAFHHTLRLLLIISSIPFLIQRE